MSAVVASASLGARLEAYICQQTPDHGAVTVSNLRRQGEGSSRENWTFEAHFADGRIEPLLLRRDPESTVLSSDRAAEFELLRALERTGFPSPGVRWLDDDGEAFGRPSMIVVQCAGQAHRSVLRDTDPLRLGIAGRLGLAQRLSDVLARLHDIDVDQDGIAPILGGARPTLAEVAHWQAAMDELAAQVSIPVALRLVFAWLEDHLPAPSGAPVLVHGDFRPANVLVHGGEFEVLLDWELARIGDRLDDLGWYTAPLYRGEHEIAGSWTHEDFLRRYEHASGVSVPRAALRFWQVLAMARLAVVRLGAVAAFIGGTGRATGPADDLARRTLAFARTGEYA